MCIRTTYSEACTWHVCVHIHYICLLKVGCASKCCLGFGSSLLSTVLLTMLYKDQLEFPFPVLTSVLHYCEVAQPWLKYRKSFHSKTSWATCHHFQKSYFSFFFRFVYLSNIIRGQLQISYVDNTKRQTPSLTVPLLFHLQFHHFLFFCLLSAHNGTLYFLFWG